MGWAGCGILCLGYVSGLTQSNQRFPPAEYPAGRSRRFTFRWSCIGEQPSRPRTSSLAIPDGVPCSSSKPHFQPAVLTLVNLRAEF